ncbi:hypothetical protein BD626DRAFT_476965 [Schizophyllum amplum]|uniref:Secreted protein n=1 Tax=Schizophyllum amplum TaxID=97359 RepID=A0A550CZT9_9AGAR|nr:hypothetical protein BD626DRAFT_476965 [Auriculariopsis ampla]
MRMGSSRLPLGISFFFAVTQRVKSAITWALRCRPPKPRPIPRCGARALRLTTTGTCGVKDALPMRSSGIPSCRLTIHLSWPSTSYIAQVIFSLV